MAFQGKTFQIGVEPTAPVKTTTVAPSFQGNTFQIGEVPTGAIYKPPPVEAAKEPSFVEKTLKEAKLTGLTLYYLPQAIDETLGISKTVREKGLPRATLDGLASFGEAIATAPFIFAKGLIGIVSPELAEKLIPETTPHPTELLLRAIGKEDWIKTSKPVQIGLSYQEQTKKNIESGMNPWLSGLMIGSQVIFDAAITGGIVEGILKGVAKPPKVTPKQVLSAQATLKMSPKATLEEIKVSYYKLAHEYHPDKVGGNTKLFNNLNESYRVLTGVKPETVSIKTIAYNLIRERPYPWQKIAKESLEPVITPEAPKAPPAEIKAPPEAKPPIVPEAIKPTAPIVPRPPIPTVVPPIAPKPEVVPKAIPKAKIAVKEAIPAEKGIIPQELQPLAQEARKYKSAEEFALTKENVIKNIDKLPISEQVKIDIKLNDIYISGKVGQPITTRVSFLKKNNIEKQKIIDILEGRNKNPEEIKKAIDVLTENQKIHKNWATKGGIFGGKEWNNKWIDIYENWKSQLQDFYNQAVKGIKEVKPEIEKPKFELKPTPEKEVAFTKIEQLESQLKQKYMPVRMKTSQFLSELWAEMEVAEAGKRYPIRDEEGTITEWTGEKSTFPDWIPEKLRSKALFEKVMDGISDIKNIKYPDRNRPAQRALYNAILDELDNRLGIDTSEIRDSIIENYDKIYEKEAPAVAGEGAPRGIRAPKEEEIKPEEIFPKEKEVEEMVKDEPFEEEIKPVVEVKLEGTLKSEMVSGGGKTYEAGEWKIITNTPKTIKLQLVKEPETIWGEISDINEEKGNIITVKKDNSGQHTFRQWEDGSFTIYPYKGGTPIYFEAKEPKYKLSPFGQNLANSDTFKAYVRENFGKPLSREEAVAIVRKYFTPDEVSVRFAQNLIWTRYGSLALGAYQDKMIKFMENPAISTPEHEVIHAYIDLFSEPGRRLDVLKEVLENNPELRTLKNAEERLADDFIDYVRFRKTFPGKIAKFFSDLLAAIKRFLGRVPRDKIKNFYEDVIQRRRPMRPRESERMIKYREIKKIGEEPISEQELEAFNYIQKELPMPEELKPALEALKKRGLISETYVPPEKAVRGLKRGKIRGTITEAQIAKTEKAVTEKGISRQVYAQLRNGFTGVKRTRIGELSTEQADELFRTIMDLTPDQMGKIKLVDAETLEAMRDFIPPNVLSKRAITTGDIFQNLQEKDISYIVSLFRPIRKVLTSGELTINEKSIGERIYDTISLAEENYRMQFRDWHEKYVELYQKAKKADKNVDRNVFGYIEFDWEVPAQTKALAEFLKKFYADSLSVMKPLRVRQKYITHTRPTFWERVKQIGLKETLREVVEPNIDRVERIDPSLIVALEYIVSKEKFNPYKLPRSQYSAYSKQLRKSVQAYSGYISIKRISIRLCRQF